MAVWLSDYMIEIRYTWPYSVTVTQSLCGNRGFKHESECKSHRKRRLRDFGQAALESDCRRDGGTNINRDTAGRVCKLQRTRRTLTHQFICSSSSQQQLYPDQQRKSLPAAGDDEDTDRRQQSALFDLTMHGLMILLDAGVDSSSKALCLTTGGLT